MIYLVYMDVCVCACLCVCVRACVRTCLRFSIDPFVFYWSNYSYIHTKCTLSPQA